MPVYEGPITDAHQHFWEPTLGHQPWLQPDAVVPFRYGDYSTLKRDYLPDDLRNDAAPTEIAHTVLVETEWDPLDLIEEVRYFEAMSKRHGMPSVMVAHASLSDPDLAAILDEMSASPFLRGIRDKPELGLPVGYQGTRLTDPLWQAGFATLGAQGLSFDLQVSWQHLGSAYALFRQHPEVPVVLNHAGLPADRRPETLVSWRVATAKLAQLDHVSAKVSGLGIIGEPWTVVANRPVLEHLAESFGSDRIMFGSNFPVDSLVTSYPELLRGFQEMTREWSRSEQEQFFLTNAQRIYRISS